MTNYSLGAKLKLSSFFSSHTVVIFDQEDEVKSVLEKVDNFVIPRMTTKQFRQHFRMNPHIFEDLLRKLYTLYPQVTKSLI
jgi:hypothetical protein